jgi:hypothetical protein
VSTPEIPMMTGSVVTVLFMETSDQRGTSEPIGVYSTAPALAAAEAQVKTHRTYTKQFVLNGPASPPRGCTL